MAVRPCSHCTAGQLELCPHAAALSRCSTGTPKNPFTAPWRPGPMTKELVQRNLSASLLRTKLKLRDAGRRSSRQYCVCSTLISLQYLDLPS